MLWNSAGSLIYLISQWVITVLVTRFFGYADAGILSLAMSLTATFQTISLFGIRNYQASDISEKYSDKTYVMLRNITSVSALIICMIFAFINRYSSTQILAILWFMLFRLSENYSDVLHGIAQRNNRLDIAGKGFAIRGIATFLSFMMSYLLGAKLLVCIMSMALIAWTVTLLFDIPMVRYICKFQFYDNLKNGFNLAKETFSLCIYLFLCSAILVVPKYFLEMLTDEITLGAYASISAPSLIISAVAIYIFTPFVAVFAKHHEEKENKKFSDLTLKIIALIVLFGAVTIILALLLGDFALKIVFGESILEFSYMLIPTLIATVITSISGFLYTLCIVIRDFKNLLIGCTSGFLATTAASPILINLLGANGTSYAMIIGSLLSAVYIFITIKFQLRRNTNGQCSN